MAQGGGGAGSRGDRISVDPTANIRRCRTNAWLVEEPESRKLLPRKAEVLSLVATVLASDSGGRWSWLMGFLSRYPGWGRMGSFIPEGNRGRKEALRFGCGNPSLTHRFCLVLAGFLGSWFGEGEGGGTGEAGRKLSKDVGSAGDWLQREPVGTLERSSAPPEARGPALCPCVCL